MLNMLAICPFCRTETWFEMLPGVEYTHTELVDRCRHCGVRIGDLLAGFDFDPLRRVNIIRFSEPMVLYRKQQLRSVMVDA